MSDDDLYNLLKGREARDEGMALVRDSNPTFSYEFHQAILSLPRGWIGQCEDIRRNWKGTIPHPNAWGANWNAAVKRGLLVELPIKVNMTGVKSHGRRTHLFRRT
jgi:hypothetical protein